MQRRYGLHLSYPHHLLDAIAAAGGTVTISMRLGDTFAHNANHSTAHKWLVVAWSDAEAAADPSATVYRGDKSKGHEPYSFVSASYVPDVIKLTGGDSGAPSASDDDRPSILEIKHYSPIVRDSRSGAGPTTLNGGSYAFGNTEEQLKWKVLGTRQRGVPQQGAFNHTTGSGFVPAHDGDYVDAIKNRKATVKLLAHETFGGMSPFASRHLRRLGRAAEESGCDPTDYSRSYTARSFVPYYAQRLSSASVINGAAGIHRSADKLRTDYLNGAIPNVPAPQGA